MQRLGFDFTVSVPISFDSHWAEAARAILLRIKNPSIPDADLEAWELQMRCDMRIYLRMARRHTAQSRWDFRKLERNTAPALAPTRLSPRL